MSGKGIYVCFCTLTLHPDIAIAGAKDLDEARELAEKYLIEESERLCHSFSIEDVEPDEFSVECKCIKIGGGESAGGKLQGG